MAIEYRGPSVPGGEVSPGSGTTGFTSKGIPFANTSGQLVTNSSGPSWDSTANTLVFPNTTGRKVLLETSVAIDTIASNLTFVNAKSGAGVSFSLAGGDNPLFVSAAGVRVGTSVTGHKLSLPSTVNMTSAVGTAGSAAALPATPESYIKVLAPNNAGTLTTLYLPLYLSTG